MRKILFIVVLIFSLQLSCSDEDNPSASGDCERTGAICNDGSRSSATGSGACSSHGGVKEWLCK